MSRLTIAERILLHMSRYDLVKEDQFNITWDLTQDGIAASLRISRAHSSIELKKLRESGRITERQSHIKGCKVKRKSYYLTPLGMEDAKRLMAFAERSGIDIMPMLDMKRCDPNTLWHSVDEMDRNALGMACVLRCSVPRTDLPAASEAVMPVDVNGMVALNDRVKDNVLSVAGGDKIREWHSAAADYWLDRDDVQERLHHLIFAGRVRDACMLIMNEKERLLHNINDDLSDILSRLNDIPEKYVISVVPVMIAVALASDDLASAGSLIGVLKERDEELGLIYSADLEMKRGDHSKALSMIRSAGKTDRLEVNLRAADALGHLGRAKEAMDLLTSMKDNILTSGTVDGLDRIYMQMADVSTASGDNDMSINYLTKALGVTTDSGKKMIYGLLASSYNAVGMREKAAEYSSRAR
ncbi:MAG: hypothetical protein LBV13_03225 [Methanomassiliicoccaceae archaeon]|jgi:hypothetical protein|nr:hypothetical protein [Methanomassiliicoccaceae archaeon]